jgi:hypothetical protein
MGKIANTFMGMEVIEDDRMPKDSIMLISYKRGPGGVMIPHQAQIVSPKGSYTLTMEGDLPEPKFTVTKHAPVV